MPLSEVESWRAFYNLQPFGPWRDNYHSAMVAYVIACAHRNPHRPPPRLSEFMYKDQETRRQEEEAATLAFFESKVSNG